MKRSLSATSTLLSLALFFAACSNESQAPGGATAGVDAGSPSDGTAAGEMAGRNMADGQMAGMDKAEGQRAGMAMNSGAPMALTARQASLAGVRFSVARRGPLDRTIRASALVVVDERRQGVVNTRVGGWVERLHVNETGVHVEAGTPLFDFYAPDLVTAQEELLIARKLAGRAGGDALIAGARRRLTLWGIADSTISAIEAEGRVRETLTILSPYAGHVLDKNVIEGERVEAGYRLFRIADLSTVWIELAIFEQDIRMVELGQSVTLRLDSYPERTFEGRVTFIDPELDPTTRTLRVRVEVPNPAGEIRPSMYGTAYIRAAGPEGVVVPLTSVLPTGDRNLAFLLRGGRVVPTDVVVGARGDSTLTVLRGIAAGDTLIASATFLFDSESNMGAAMAGIMLDMGMGLDMGGMDMGDMDAPRPDTVPGVVR